MCINFTLEGRCLEIVITNIYLDPPLSIPSYSTLVTFPLWIRSLCYSSRRMAECHASLSRAVTYKRQFFCSVFLGPSMYRALMSCLSLIPGNCKSWLLVITKHRCSCSTGGPVRLPDHVCCHQWSLESCWSASPSELPKTARCQLLKVTWFKDVHASFGLL